MFLFTADHEFTIGTAENLGLTLLFIAHDLAAIRPRE